MAYPEEFLNELEQVILSVWTEIEPNGVYQAEHVELIPWEDLPTPYAVIFLPEMAPWQGNQEGTSDQSFVEIYYVAVASGPSSGIRGRLEALATTLWPAGTADGPLTLGQVLERPQRSWSQELAPNQRFLQVARCLRRAGRLRFPCLTEEPLCFLSLCFVCWLVWLLS